jgi:hypothetical protein
VGQEVKETQIDVTDFRKRYIVHRQAAGLGIKGDLRFVSVDNPLVKELKDANRVRN